MDEDKTKYLLTTHKEVSSIGIHATVSSYIFEVVNMFVYLRPRNVSTYIKGSITDATLGSIAN